MKDRTIVGYKCRFCGKEIKVYYERGDTLHREIDVSEEAWRAADGHMRRHRQMNCKE